MRFGRLPFLIWFLFDRAAVLLPGLIPGHDLRGIGIVLALVGLCMMLGRLADAGRSQWLALLYLVPFVGPAVCIWLLFQKSRPESDKMWGSGVASPIVEKQAPPEA